MIFKLDSRKRIPIGKLIQDKDIKLLEAKVKKDGTIVLTPMKLTPALLTLETLKKKYRVNTKGTGEK